MREEQLIEAMYSREKGTKERQAHLARALLALRPADRRLFFRKYYYRQSTAQIAAELGTTPRAVEGWLYRIKKQLQKQLGGESHDK